MFFPNQDILKLVAKISFDSKFQKIFVKIQSTQMSSVCVIYNLLDLLFLQICSSVLLVSIKPWKPVFESTFLDSFDSVCENYADLAYLFLP